MNFSKLISGPLLAYRLINNLNRQKQFLHQHIQPVLDSAMEKNDGSLEAGDIKKITGYYGLAVPAILGEAFCALRGNEMIFKERMASTCQGAMTGLFDDFFDKQLLTDAALKAFIDHPEQFNGNTSNEKLFLFFYKTAIDNCNDVGLMKEHLYKVYHAQVDSKKQGMPGLTGEEIKEITIRKGGASVLFYRTVFTNRMNSEEEKMLFQLGGLMQLSNDIFDLYKDQQAAIQTLVTTTKDIKEIRNLFTELLQQGYAAAYAAGYSKENTRKFIDIVSLGIFSRCFVCLDQLEEKQKSSNNIFSPSLYTRKDMICDMDTVSNKWRSLVYHSRHF